MVTKSNSEEIIINRFKVNLRRLFSGDKKINKRYFSYIEYRRANKDLIQFFSKNRIWDCGNCKNPCCCNGPILSCNLEIEYFLQNYEFYDFKKQIKPVIEYDVLDDSICPFFSIKNYHCKIYNNRPISCMRYYSHDKDECKINNGQFHNQLDTHLLKYGELLLSEFKNICSDYCIEFFLVDFIKYFAVKEINSQ